MPDSARSLLLTHLQSKGLKFTPERRDILNAITGLKGHFDAEELYMAIKNHGDKISRATVYRALPLFTQSGIIRETIRSGEKSTYENILGAEHHDHLLCLQCGQVLEFKDDEIERLQDELCGKYRFTPVDHVMSIRGYCKKCSKQQGYT